MPVGGSDCLQSAGDWERMISRGASVMDAPLFSFGWSVGLEDELFQCHSEHLVIDSMTHAWNSVDCHFCPQCLKLAGGVTAIACSDDRVRFTMNQVDSCMNRRNLGWSGKSAGKGNDLTSQNNGSLR